MTNKIITKFVLDLLLFVFVLCFSFLKDAECAGCLQIKIWSDKYEYLTREPISVKYEIKNISDTTVVMIFDAVKEYFVIKDQDGRGYANILLSTYASRSDKLKPNELYKGSEGIDGRYRIHSAGEYTCYMELPADFVFPFCSEKSKSNIIKIKVKDPKGNEKKALDLYLEAQKLHWCKDKDPKKWERAFYKYLELAKKYPKSVYAPMSLYTALFKAHVIKDKNEVISVCKKLIENYPESYYIDDTFYNLVGNYKVLEEKSGAIKYMKELIKKYPNTKISERAEYWLEKIEKWEFK